VESRASSAHAEVVATALLDEATTHAAEILIGVLEMTNLFNDAIADAGADAIRSNADVIVMKTIRLDGPQRPRDLIESTSLTSGGLTNLIDRLCDAGLVRRRRIDVGDRRAVLIELTPDGDDMLDRLARAVGTALRLAVPLLERWHELFTEMGIEVGAIPSSGVGTRRRLERLRQLGVIGRRGFLVLSAVFGPDDPAPNHTMHVLWLAAKPFGTRPRAITQVTGLSSATTTDLLDRLERRGLIVRLSDAADGRAVVVRPTETGRAMLERAIAELTPILPDVAAAFLPA